MANFNPSESKKPQNNPQQKNPQQEISNCCRNIKMQVEQCKKNPKNDLKKTEEQLNTLEACCKRCGKESDFAKLREKFNELKNCCKTGNTNEVNSCCKEVCQYLDKLAK